MRTGEQQQQMLATFIESFMTHSIRIFISIILMNIYLVVVTMKMHAAIHLVGMCSLFILTLWSSIIYYAKLGSRRKKMV